MTKKNNPTKTLKTTKKALILKDKEAMANIKANPKEVENLFLKCLMKKKG